MMTSRVLSLIAKHDPELAMLEAGKSMPGPDALYQLTGTREMDATAILDYFAPLQAWLDEQNESRTCGW